MPKRRPISEATPAQREKVRTSYCTASGDGLCVGPMDPAHLLPRTATTVGQDDPLAVVGLCRYHHEAYDAQRTLDLLPHLEACGYRAELAFAVMRVGLMATLRRVTNSKWSPDSDMRKERY